MEVVAKLRQLSPYGRALSVEWDTSALEKATAKTCNGARTNVPKHTRGGKKASVESVVQENITLSFINYMKANFHIMEA